MRPHESPEPVQLTPRLPTRWWFAATCAALLVLAACGGGGGDGDEAVPSVGDDGASGEEGESAMSEEEREQALLDWVACMREQGVDVPDPEVDADGNMRMPGMQVTGDGSGPSIEEAQEACGEIPAPPGGGGGRSDESELEDAALEYAQCMRDNGFDMPDPQVDGGRVTFGGGPGGGGGGGGGGGQNIQDDPAFQEAQEACQGMLGGPGGGGGTGGGSEDAG